MSLACKTKTPSGSGREDEKIRLRRIQRRVHTTRASLHTERGQYAWQRIRFAKARRKLLGALEKQNSLLSEDLKLTLRRLQQRDAKLSAHEARVDELEDELDVLETRLQRNEDAVYGPMEAASSPVSSRSSRSQSSRPTDTATEQDDSSPVTTIPEALQTYYNSVGEVTLARETLFNYDYDNTVMPVAGSSAFELHRSTTVNVKTHDEEAFRRETLVQNLKTANDLAEMARARCLREGIVLEDEGEQSELLEALRYHAQSSQGGPAQISNGEESGITTMELHRVPTAPPEERISEWTSKLTGVQSEDVDAPPDVESRESDGVVTPFTEIDVNDWPSTNSPYSYMLENLQENDSMRSQGLITVMRDRNSSQVLVPFGTDGEAPSSPVTEPHRLSVEPWGHIPRKRTQSFG